jgi:hypothetical protein
VRRGEAWRGERKTSLTTVLQSRFEVSEFQQLPHRAIMLQYAGLQHVSSQASVSHSYAYNKETPSVQAAPLGTTSITLSSHNSTCNNKTALRWAFSANSPQGKHQLVIQFLPARSYSTSTWLRYKEDQPDCQEEKHWAHWLFSLLHNRRSAVKKTRRHCRYQPRLAATEGVSVSAHQIHRTSLCVSVLITAENICYSYVGVRAATSHRTK